MKFLFGSEEEGYADLNRLMMHLGGVALTVAFVILFFLAGQI